MESKQCLVVFVVVAALVFAPHQASAFDPIINTGPSALSKDGTHVSVHVSDFFDMTLDTRGPGQGFRLTETVMSGFFSMYLDRARENGRLRGPIKVKLAGMTLYDNVEPLPGSSTINSMTNSMTNTLNSALPQV